MVIGILVFSDASRDVASNSARLVEEALALGHEARIYYEPLFAFANDGSTLSVRYDDAVFCCSRCDDCSAELRGGADAACSNIRGVTLDWRLRIEWEPRSIADFKRLK